MGLRKVRRFRMELDHYPNLRAWHAYRVSVWLRGTPECRTALFTPLALELQSLLPSLQLLGLAFGSDSESDDGCP